MKRDFLGKKEKTPTSVGNQDQRRNVSWKEAELDEDLESFTLPLLLFDLLPVIFFGFACVLSGGWFQSFLFSLGGCMAMVGGICKVAWKYMVVFHRKNIVWLNRQFWFFLLTGFLVMLIGAILARTRVSFLGLLMYIFRSKALFLFAGGLFFVLLMMLLSLSKNHNSLRFNWFGEIFNTFGQLLILLGVVFLLYVQDYYPADSTAKACLENPPPGITITQMDRGLEIRPEKEIRAAIIFYPGAKVEYTAYLPLMEECAKQGFLCLLLQMPDNLAVLDVSAADAVIGNYPEVEEWYIAGHSLGGAMAAHYFEHGEYKDSFRGVILLAAYSTTDLSDTDLRVLSVYGSRDSVLDYEKYLVSLTSDFYPEDMTEYVIEGGNHAFFGDYGHQAGDGMSTVTRKYQWETTANVIGKWIAE